MTLKDRYIERIMDIALTTGSEFHIHVFVHKGGRIAAFQGTNVPTHMKNLFYMSLKERKFVSTFQILSPSETIEFIRTYCEE